MNDWYADGTSGHQGDSSEQAEPSRRRRIDTAYTLVLNSLKVGLTWRDLATVTGWHHGEASSALSNLHRQGRVERLAFKRDGCGVYVTPANVDGRATVQHRSHPKPPTRDDVEAAVSEWWDHARYEGKGRLVEILCDELGVTR